MIPSVKSSITSFHARPFGRASEHKKDDDEPVVKNSNVYNRFMSGFHRTTNAFTEYSARGFKGDLNSNFYEFLAMGRVAYLVGSATFIGLFNGLNHFFDARGHQQAKKVGTKFATGVVFYGLAKTLSKELISRPIAWATGVDIEQPYENSITLFPKVVGKHVLKPDEIIMDMDKSYPRQKLWESKEFPRIDLVEKEFFDKVAKKNGLGENLNCSETEVKPILKDIISTATTAERISSFLWAACGVGVAACGNWDEFYDTHLNSSKLGRFVPDKNKSFMENTKDRFARFYNHSKMALHGFKEELVNSSKEFYYGDPKLTGYKEPHGILHYYKKACKNTYNTYKQNSQGLKIKEKLDIAYSTLKNELGTASSEYYRSIPKTYKAHVGKALFWTATISSVYGIANSIIRARNMGKNLCDENVIDNSKDSMVV